ncbi:MAG: universal stress protein [Pirellulales bacterium]|nr:universal stress protein [Pirellulales bacterium]
MKLVKRILVGLNLKPDTEAVLEMACQVAKRLGSEVCLLHVIPLLSSLRLPQEFSDWSILVELAKKESTERLAEYRARLEQEGVPVTEAKILEGIAFDRILAHADDLDPNVIIAGVGSAGTDQQMTLGITAERLCRKSSRPVWLVNSKSKVVPSSILCPVDFSKSSSRALRNALFLARRFEAELTVLTVVPPVSILYGWLGRNKEAEQRAQVNYHQRALDDFLGPFDLHGVMWRKSMRHGPPDREILAAAAETSPDLIVMGSVGLSGLSRILLGSVAERVLQAVPCSMLLVKAEDTFRLQVTDQVADIESHFQHGTELLRQGFTEEARRQFQHCISANVMFAPAWEAIADCYERLKDTDRAAECRAEAKQVRETLSWRRVEADIRSRHPLWRRGD